MKVNKWTAGLAAVGLVSLASVAQAEEKVANSVMTALSSTTISGYVDTSMQWNFGTGNANLPPYKFNSPSKADGFNLDVVQLRIDKPLDDQDWSAGYRVDLWFGPDANTLGTQSPGSSASDFAIRQAYVLLRTPVGSGLDWKVGVFDSIIGYESVESGNDPNYTRSYGHSIEPQTETGILAIYHINNLIMVQGGIADAIGPQINYRAQQGGNGTTGGTLGGVWNAVYSAAGVSPAEFAGSNPKAESYKCYMGSIALTAPDSWGFLAKSTLYGGGVSGFNPSTLGSGAGGNQSSWYVGSTIATPLTDLRLGVAFDYLNAYRFNATSPGGSTIFGESNPWALGGYASYQCTEKLSFHGRLEYFNQGMNFNVNGVTPLSIGYPSTEKIFTTTLTAQYDLWKNVLSRVELRWDHALNDEHIFGGTTAGAPNADNAWMLAANIIYKF